MFNNLGYHDVEQCNLNPCGEHSGGGGGLPHYHLDGFHSRNICLYGPANYSSTTAHPPLIGFSYDGGWIYGRHLYAGSEGSTVALDNCGGHIHSSAVSYVNGVYHYHSQVLNATGTGGPRAGGFGAAGTPFTYSTMGPSNCWRGNASAIPSFLAGGQDMYTQACTGSTAYYFNPNAGQSAFNTTWTKSTCGANTTTSSKPPPPPSPPKPPPPPPSPSPPPNSAAVKTSTIVKNTKAAPPPAGRHLMTVSTGNGVTTSTDGGVPCTGSWCVTLPCAFSCPTTDASSLGSAPPGFIANFPNTVAQYLGLRDASAISISGVQSQQIPQLVPAQYYFVIVSYTLLADNSTMGAQLVTALNALPSNAGFVAELKSHFAGNYTVTMGTTTLVGGPTSPATVPRMFMSLAVTVVAMMLLL